MREYRLDRAEDFAIDISNKKIYAALEKYKIKIGLPILCPLNKREIKSFEKMIRRGDLIGKV